MNRLILSLQNLFISYGFNPLEQVAYYVSLGVGLLFTILYTYQYIYILIAIFHKPLSYPATDQSKRYGVLIAARNEEQVLPELLKSLLGQTYPADKIDVFVVADNCTDRTADVARALGATVYERQNKEKVGKGYALEFLFQNIERDKGLRFYDAYMVFDADNVLRKNYVEEMDKAYCAGNHVLTSYRNSKNYGKTWVSAGYALWFMRESRHLNNPRSILHTSAAISGTGFLIDSGIIERNGGWKHFLLTEDIEFTADCITHGESVGYCHNAELFDEQPETFRQSWRQRSRWAKGFFQVFHGYGGGLFKGSFKLQWACYDMMMNIMPAFLLSLIQITSVTTLLLINLFVNHFVSFPILKCYLLFFAFGYGLVFIIGLITMITEWKKIHYKKWRVVMHLFSFPIFMLSYIPISFCALFARVEWKPITHKYAVRTEDIEGQAKGKNISATEVPFRTEEAETDGKNQ